MIPHSSKDIMNEISNNLKQINNRIHTACNNAGRNYEDVTLIAVSKTKPVSMLMEAYDEGVRDFGENYVNELVTKIDSMPQDIRWHMIGHLQTNKVKYLVGKVHMIHSVDSVKLAEAISKEAVKKTVTVNILIEINIGNEESKFGKTIDEGEALVNEIKTLPNLNVCGLMCIAPFVKCGEENRQYFSSMKKLASKLSLESLSMGMSGDFETAIEEGATFVRVGTSIFGERDYKRS